jgi:hypothetical protein
MVQMMADEPGQGEVADQKNLALGLAQMKGETQQEVSETTRSCQPTGSADTRKFRSMRASVGEAGDEFKAASQSTQMPCGLEFMVFDF